jgi:hypothetical protein
MNDTELIERLQTLEYDIRQSITVRENQEEDLETRHAQEARSCGIRVGGLLTKGDLLNAVQTALRSLQAQMRE